MSDRAASWSIYARWLFDAERGFVENVRVEISDGFIVDVIEGTSAVRKDFRVDLLLPGLINAHCHLEYSHLRGMLPGGTIPFGQWLESIIQQRGAKCDAKCLDAAVGELIRGGCTLVCDSTTDGASGPVFERNRLPHVLWREVIGLTSERAEQSWNDAKEWLAGCGKNDNAYLCAYGINPHAPYSVGPDLIARLNEVKGVGYAWHLAETEDENELFRNGTGSIADFLSRMNLPAPEGSAESAAEWLDANQLLDRCNVAFHGNVLSMAELQHFRAPRGLVHCPLTHKYFDRPPAPLRQWLDAGVNVCIGTDSLASAKSLSMWECLQTVATRHDDLLAEEVLAMGTLNACKLLILHRAGRGGIAPGAAAHLTGASAHGISSPEALLQLEMPCKITTIIDGVLRCDGVRGE